MVIPWNKSRSIGQKIKLRREQLDMTQTELAKELHIQQQRVQELEDTSKRPSAEMLLKVSDVLDVSILYFLTDCKLNDTDEEILLVKYRQLDDKNKKLVIDFVKLILISCKAPSHS